MKPTGTLGSTGRSGPSGKNVMNSFHMRKLNKTDGTSQSESEGKFELLKESNAYPYNNTDECPPIQRTYDYEISPQHRVDITDNTQGIRREVSVSVTHGDPDNKPHFPY